MDNGKRIVVLGSGGWGTAIAMSACSSGHNVTLWSAFEKEINDIKQSGKNKLLPGVDIPREIELTSSLSCLEGADICIMAVPSFATASVSEQAAELLERETVVVNIGKGFDDSSLERLSVVIGKRIHGNDVVVLSGPSHAEEVARAVPTALVAASENESAAEYIQDVLSTGTLRIYTNTDVVGVELGGAMKNVIALSCGIADGMGYGDNTKAALMTRGLREIGLIGHAMGARNETFAGLTGLGDLIVTCTSMHSRNRRAGILIGRGLSPQDAINDVGTVEGYHAAKNIHLLSERYGVEMPINESCYRICYEGASPEEEIRGLMTRPLRREHDETWLD